jgi:hypothetical protein
MIMMTIITMFASRGLINRTAFSISKVIIKRLFGNASKSLSKTLHHQELPTSRRLTGPTRAFAFTRAIARNAPGPRRQSADIELRPPRAHMAQSLPVDPRQEPRAVLDTSQTRSLALEQRNMSDASSDSANEPNDQIEPVIASEGSAVASPLDFSGSLLGFPENSAGSAQVMDEPFRAPELALEAADLSEALCAKIAPVSFGDRVFLLHSEAEAWRYAVETMRRYHRIVGRPKRRRLIAFAPEFRMEREACPMA